MKEVVVKFQKGCVTIVISDSEDFNFTQVEIFKKFLDAKEFLSQFEKFTCCFYSKRSRSIQLKRVNIAGFKFEAAKIDNEPVSVYSDYSEIIVSNPMYKNVESKKDEEMEEEMIILNKYAIEFEGRTLTIFAEDSEKALLKLSCNEGKLLKDVYRYNNETIEVSKEFEIENLKEMKEKFEEMKKEEKKLPEVPKTIFVVFETEVIEFTYSKTTEYSNPLSNFHNYESKGQFSQGISNYRLKEHSENKRKFTNSSMPFFLKKDDAFNYMIKKAEEEIFKAQEKFKEAEASYKTYKSYDL